MHIPVLAKEFSLLINKLKHRIKTVVDCTFGAGGHSRICLEAGLNVVAMDRDPTVGSYANKLLEEFPTQFQFKLGAFSQLKDSYDLLIADLGMSTMQLNNSRGFSFMNDSPLNMRMDSNEHNDLTTVINNLSVKNMTEIIKKYSEEPKARKIAENIDKYRLHTYIDTTMKLRKAIGIDLFPILARVFQAFRIYINNELEELETLLALHSKLPIKNSIIISFHSLEDKLVKQASFGFEDTYYITASDEEILVNPKSRSAKLRGMFGLRENIWK